MQIIVKVVNSCDVAYIFVSFEKLHYVVSVRQRNMESSSVKLNIILELHNLLYAERMYMLYIINYIYNTDVVII